MPRAAWGDLRRSFAALLAFEVLFKSLAALVFLPSLTRRPGALVLPDRADGGVNTIITDDPKLCLEPRKEHDGLGDTQRPLLACRHLLE